MKVEIWSDIVCPFCYIGKRKFEHALNQFKQKDQVEIVWRSFQLDPDLSPVEGQSIHQYLADRKAVTLQQGKEMNDYMANKAKEVGLEYNFDQVIVSNTMKGHRLLHLAKKHGIQHQLKEKLFAAYYTEGKDISDTETLVQIGEAAGLQGDEIRAMLQSEAYIKEVQFDQYNAQQIGVQGVPFFVFNNKYAVSGAQDSSVFSEVLLKVWEEEKPVIVSSASAGFCTTDGVCN